MKTGYLELGTSDAGKSTAVLLNEWGHVVCGGPLAYVRDEAKRQGYTSLTEFPTGQRPTFPVRDDLAKPKGLSEAGSKAYETIVALLRKQEATRTGGCKAFYSPAEWAARGEKYGEGAELVVVYDGGDLMRFFSLDACYNELYDAPVERRYATYEGMQTALEAIGLYFEECTSWYCAVYAR
jgi:hypothetical protein